MTGYRISTTDTITDTTRPKLYDDAMMSDGSLVLHDLGHSLGGVAGVPASGALIPNVAWRTANVLVSGAPGQAALGGTVTSGLTASGEGLIERSGKGGLHAIVSQTNNVAGHSFNVGWAAAVVAYILANPTHAYYFSLWERITRASTAASGFGLRSGLYNNASGATSNDLYYLGAAGQYGAAGASSAALPGSNTAGNVFTAIGVSGWAGTVPAIANAQGAAVSYGSFGAFTSFDVNKSRSGIFYRCYLEDLTAGGRSFATVSALDQALFNTAFGAGGKFAGDTFTAPSGYP